MDMIELQARHRRMLKKEPVLSSLVNPFEFSAENGYAWYRGNLHTHSLLSDGTLHPQARLDGYIEQCYDFLCISDHLRIARIDGLSRPDSFRLIQGAELHPESPFGGQIYHFLALNIEDDITSENMAPQEVIDAVRSQAGSVWLCHPHWSGINVLRDVLPLDGLSGLEVFNAGCMTCGRGEGAVHWDEWMSLTNRLRPAIGVDDSHGKDAFAQDTYRCWTMVRAAESSTRAILTALETGAAYASTGPEIHDIRLRVVNRTDDGWPVVQAHVRCSEAKMVLGVGELYGTHFCLPGSTFTEAVFDLEPGIRWVRFEIIAADGAKAWSNPFDLTALDGF
jgi:hypothetical protein